MSPADNFKLVNKQFVSWSAGSLLPFYLPIVGRDAIVLYEYLTLLDEGKISDILNHLNFGIQDFRYALDQLTAINLIDLYSQGNNYTFQLKSPKQPADFLADDFLARLLIAKIGQPAFDRLADKTTPSGKNISKKFSQVYSVNFNGDVQTIGQEIDSTLDINSFKNIMKQQNYAFSDEASDILSLYELADKYDLNWYELFKLAENSMNTDRSLNIAALRNNLIMKNQNTPVLSSFTADERNLIEIAQIADPLDFLESLKGQEGGFVTASEKKILLSLTRQNVPNQVQNILTHYSLIQTNQSSLNAKFAESVANDWVRHGVNTAELALKRIETYLKERQERENNNSYINKSKQDMTKESAKVPEWHDESKKVTTSQADLEELRRLREESLKKIQGEKN
jgi:Replication initiation/membrane attachment protein